MDNNKNAKEKQLKAIKQAKNGNTEYIKGNFSLAISSYTKAIALSQNNNSFLVALLTNRAIANLRLHDYIRSIEDCYVVIEIDPEYIKAYIVNAFALFLCGELQESNRIYEKINKLEPNNLILQKLKKAREYLIQKKNDKNQDIQFIIESGLIDLDLDLAESDPKKKKPKEMFTVELKNEDEGMPSLLPAGEFLGDCCETYLSNLKTNRSKEAIKQKEMGNKAFSCGDYLIALKCYSRAICLNPKEDEKMAIFFSNRSLVYLKLGRYHEAISDCTASIERKPLIKAFARRGSARFSLGDFAMAANDFKIALTFEPHNNDCLFQLEKCLEKIKDVCQEKLKLNTNKKKIKSLLQNTLLDLKIIENTRQQNEKQKKKEEKKQSKSFVERFSQIKSSDPQTISKRVECYLQGNMLNDSINDFRRSLRIEPDNNQLKDNIRVSLKQKKRGLYI
eukprot:TRINITY_DN12051_c0_g1_i1.p1 TRINITY_DN12051_c0_g1~~TRINITY_DN12051_c0_g1_i1.p1  ORF type:complete len:449 (-),score=110.97 TRINITY_DN12051_c0_g1_i1:42-1388(-)